MKIGKAGDDWLRLGLSGYQFPNAQDMRKRCSWHLVNGEASCSEGIWKFQWQALTCDESGRFTDWLRMASDWLDAEAPGSGCAPASPDFTEPNLSFSVDRSRDGGGLMVVALNMEFRPPWHAPSRRFGQATILHVPVDAEELRLAAAEWAGDVAKYPDDARAP